MKLLGALIAFTALAATTPAGSARADDKDAEEMVKRDLKALEGKWHMVRQDLEGREDDGKGIQKNGVLFDGKDYTFLRNGLSTGSTATIALDPTKDPKEINLKITGGTATGNTQLGIYRFTDEGRLEICLNQPRGKGSDKRPTKFTTKPDVGSGSIMYVLEKDKE